MDETTTRPWGSFRQFTKNEKCTVKVITILDGNRTSLQRHKNRKEMWYVLEGSPRIVKKDRYIYLRRGDTIAINEKELHRIEGACRILEISFGKFDENDIERLEDDYNRMDVK